MRLYFLIDTLKFRSAVTWRKRQTAQDECPRHAGSRRPPSELPFPQLKSGYRPLDYRSVMSAHAFLAEFSVGKRFWIHTKLVVTHNVSMKLATTGVRR
ncbi:hypothetical protein BDV19DRAFT_258146 [Aspergillus venezuelensis]